MEQALIPNLVNEKVVLIHFDALVFETFHFHLERRNKAVFLQQKLFFIHFGFHAPVSKDPRNFIELRILYQRMILNVQMNKFNRLD